MIIGSATQIQTLLAELSSTRFSSLLPIEALVLKKLSAQSYLLQINNQTLEVTTDKPLETGEKYLVSIHKDPKNAALILKHFHKPPLTEDQAIFPLKELISHFQKPSKASLTELHSTLLTRLSTSSNKEEFTLLTQLLFSLTQQTVSLPFNYRGGFGLIQYKKKRKQEKQSQDEVQFYAHLNRLGPLDGIIRLINDDVHIQINVLFEQSRRILEELRNEFSFDNGLTIQLKEEISPLFVLNDKILDIRL